MKFELPPNEYKQFDPLRESVEKVKTDWKIPLEELQKLVEGNEGLSEMLDEVLYQCQRYTKTVLDERRMLFEEGRGPEYAQWDEQRSRTHNATQDTLRAFVRNLLRSGKTEQEVLAVLPNPTSRASCGSFALTLTLSRAADEVEG